MKHFAYCPMNIKHNVALEYAKTYSQADRVIVIYSACNGRLYHIGTTFTKPIANNYGFDLYLYQLDESNNETYVDCGSFN